MIARKLALASLLVLPACKGEPLPADKADYAGQWRGGGIDLLITSDGGCSYERVSGSGRTSINGPIKRFDGDDFVVGILFFDTTFDVSVPPTETPNGWTMTVDGVEVTRIAK